MLSEDDREYPFGDDDGSETDRESGSEYAGESSSEYQHSNPDEEIGNEREESKNIEEDRINSSSKGEVVLHEDNDIRGIPEPFREMLQQEDRQKNDTSTLEVQVLAIEVQRKQKRPGLVRRLTGGVAAAGGSWCKARQGRSWCHLRSDA